jgi:hypothetical protein
MKTPTRDLPPLVLSQTSADFILKRPARPRCQGRGVEHGMLVEKGLDGVPMLVGMEEETTKVLLLITPILTINLHVSLAFTLPFAL